MSPSFVIRLGAFTPVSMIRTFDARLMRIRRSQAAFPRCPAQIRDEVMGGKEVGAQAGVDLAGSDLHNFRRLGRRHRQALSQ
jgi:hypothetical protein